MFVLCFVFCLIGASVGIVAGLFIQRRFYDKWFESHCYFCCNKFSNEDLGKTTSFETDITDKQNAHLSCWERNMFYEEEI